MTCRLTLLHTNDLHGRLDSGRAAWLAARKAELAPCLLLDSGDAVSCGNVDFKWGGEPIHELMNAAGYDAGALGNREFHFRTGPQRAKLRRARFPILSANLVEPPGYGGVRSELLLEPLPGLSVRVFGLTVPMVTAAMAARWLSPARFADPLATARELLADRGAAVSVCLSHLGLTRDRTLAAAELPLDLVLGGHSHTATAEHHGATWVFQNEPHGGTVTCLTLTITAGRLADVQHESLLWDGG